MIASGVIDRRIGTAGTSGSAATGAGGPTKLASAAWVLAISRDKSVVGRLLRVRGHLKVCSLNRV